MTTISRVSLACFLALVASCTVTRRPAAYGPEIRMSLDEAELVDAASAKASTIGEDPHRRCEHWRAVQREAEVQGQAGVVAYAEDVAGRLCNVAFERALVEAQAALTSAEASPEDAEVQLEAAMRVRALIETLHPLGASHPDNVTIQTIVQQASPVFARLATPDASCDAKVVFADVQWGLARSQEAAESYAGPLRECIDPLRADRVVSVFRQDNRCDEAVAVVADVWPRATGDFDQVRLLDAVMSCSDAYTMRRNFAFVPPEVLLDYQALLSRREAEAAQQQYEEERARLAEDCRLNCMSMYGETGACMSGCGGDSRCVSGCRSMGDACDRSCG